VQLVNQNNQQGLPISNNNISPAVTNPLANVTNNQTNIISQTTTGDR
jgi:hypothetical protein